LPSPDGRSRLRALQASLPAYGEELGLLERLLDLDPAASLNKMRTLTERMLLELCSEHQVSWGAAEPTLERMIGPLLAGGHLPRHVGLHVRTVQTNASAGSHYQPHPLDDEHATVALMALLAVLEWSASRDATVDVGSDSVVLGRSTPIRAHWLAVPVLLAFFALGLRLLEGASPSPSVGPDPEKEGQSAVDGLEEAFGRWSSEVVCLARIEPLNVEPEMARVLDLHLRAMLESPRALRSVELGPYPYDDQGRVAAIQAAHDRSCGFLFRGALGLLGTTYTLNLELASVSRPSSRPYRTHRLTDSVDRIIVDAERLVIELFSGAEGEVDREAVHRSVAGNSTQLKRCYEAALARDPDLAGRIVVAWDIATDGHVRSVSVVESTVADAELERCVTGEVTGWLFPAGFDGSFVWPFMFRGA
jgi:hypothetical protein